MEQTQSIWGDPKPVFEPYQKPKIAHEGQKKSNKNPKLSQNQKSDLKELLKIKVF